MCGTGPGSGFLTSSSDHSETPLGLGAKDQRLCFQGLEIPNVISPQPLRVLENNVNVKLILRAIHFCRGEQWGWWVGQQRDSRGGGGAEDDGGGEA